MHIMITQLSCADFLFNKISCSFSPMPFGWANSSSFLAVVENSSLFNNGLEDMRNFAIVSFMLGTGRFPSLFCSSNVFGPTSVFLLLGTANFVAVEDLSKFLLNAAALMSRLPL